MALFQSKVEQKYLSAVKDIDTLFTQYEATFKDPERQATIRQTKEEEYQGKFLIDLFVNLLGYTLKPDNNFNLVREHKNETDSKSADGAIVIDGKTVGVIELKDYKTQELKKVEPQVFGYKNNHKDCHYIITSNFERLRFYIDNAVEFIEFNLFSLDKESFKRLWLCLSYDSISRDVPRKIKNESVSTEDQITKQLYKDYSAFKRALFKDIVEQNPQFDKLELFKKTQKLLDRFLFVFFAEDKGLLPPNSVIRIIDQWDKRNEDALNEYQPLYRRLKLYFKYLNEGHKGVREEIFGYNGGLFRTDEVLDALTISDEVLKQHALKMVAYDFDTEVDVNILGHIFENSLTEIEEITNEITTGQKTTSKRKRDGVFYTPRYITKYIVENTIGRLCEEKKAKLGINEELFDVKWKKKKKEAIEILDNYRDWLLQLTICDPACGSGAFLNMALEFLMSEHHWIAEQKERIVEGTSYSKAYSSGYAGASAKERVIQGSMTDLYNIENVILENNLYGVDINEESVEIAKLALWLHTAKPQRKLTTLSNNIKCGNSLISDPAVAGDKAFDWQEEFPHIFEKGGFDVVIGNPPYVRSRDNRFETEKEYYSATYNLFKEKPNLYLLFMEKAYFLLKADGAFGFITPNAWLGVMSAEPLREFLLQNTTFSSVINLLGESFPGVGVETSIVTYLKQKSGKETLYQTIYDQVIEEDNLLSINQHEWLRGRSYIIDLKSDNGENNLLGRLIDKFRPLKSYYDVYVGLQAYEKGKGLPKQTEECVRSHPFDFEYKYDDTTYPYLNGGDVRRYTIQWSGQWLRYGEWLSQPRTLTIFNGPRILIREITGEFPNSIQSCYVEDVYLNNKSILNILGGNNQYDLKYLLAILNSRLISFYIVRRAVKGNRGLFPKVVAEDLKNIPIREIPINEQSVFIVLTDTISNLVKRLYDKRTRYIKRLQGNFEGINITNALNHFDKLDFKGFLKELGKQKIKLSLKQQDEWEEYFDYAAAECRAISAEIAETDATIDKMVYELYGLTEEEIAIVENS